MIYWLTYGVKFYIEIIKKKLCSVLDFDFDYNFFNKQVNMYCVCDVNFKGENLSFCHMFCPYISSSCNELSQD